MADLQTVVSNMSASGAFRKLMMNPLNQFGRAPRSYLGATLLPERLVPNNKFTETMVKYRTVLANHGTRYSPAVKKGNDIVGTMEVSLLHQDIGAEFTSADYDAMLQFANVNAMSTNTGNPTMAGVVALTNWYQTKIILPLVELVEKMRWEALISAQIVATGVNYSETVNYPNPTGQRVAAGGDWTDDTYDPLQEFFERMNFAAALGYNITRIIAPRPVLFALLNNAKVKAAVGGYINVSGGALVGNSGRVDPASLNAYMGRYGLPDIETYDLQYRTQTGSGFFLPRDSMLFVAGGERDIEIDLGDNEYLPVRSPVGYVGVGRPAGVPDAGRVTQQEIKLMKPPRLEAEAWQATLPIITDPQSVFVINGITTS